MAFRIGRRWDADGEYGTVISPFEGIPSVGGVHWTNMAAVSRNMREQFQAKVERQLQSELKAVEKHFDKKLKELEKEAILSENEKAKQDAIIAEQKKRAASCPTTAQEARQKISIETG